MFEISGTTSIIKYLHLGKNIFVQSLKKQKQMENMKKKTDIQLHTDRL